MATTAITAYPLSYSKVCDTFRPRLGQAAAIRTELGSKTFIDYLSSCATHNSVVREHISERRQACIQHKLGQAGLGESGGMHIAYHDVIKLLDDAVRELVQKITSAMGDLAMGSLHAPLLVVPLRQGQLFLGATIDALRFNLSAFKEGHKLLQSQVDADVALRPSGMDGHSR
jgi:phosphotransferase system IIB component